MTDLYSLISFDVPLKRTAGTNGGEFHGACPFCGGKDRLAVWPFADRPSFWCRQCEKGGDAIQYLREKGMSYQDACAQLDIPLDRQSAPRPFIPPVECKPPCQAWRSAAAAFVLYAQAKLQSAAHILAYLEQRGLTRATIDKALIGYNPAVMERSRAKWGMEPHEQHGDRFWLSQGIVIPTHISGTFWKVQIRKEHVADGEDRYKTIPGSSNALYGADTLVAGNPAMLVEGPFDALAAQQEASDLIGVVACGTSGARRSRWLTKLALCNGVLVSLDADAAGDKASSWWIENIEGARRWRPFYADPSQMLQDGGDVRQWVLAGLGRSAPQAPLKTIIAGSRKITDMAIVKYAIQQSGFEITEVVSGGAQGVDTLAQQWAKAHDIPLKVFMAKWDIHGKSAGPIRNQEMADYADQLIAIWDGVSLGTRHMIDCANRKGIRVSVTTFAPLTFSGAPCCIGKRKSSGIVRYRWRDCDQSALVVARITIGR